MSARKLDIVIFGATGWVGRYAIENLAKTVAQENHDIKWAVAGRSAAKVRAILEDVGVKLLSDLSAIPIIVADVSDDASLRAMAKQTKVVANCVGPYRLWGEQVVKVCVEEGTHHVDVSGEVQYLEKMEIKYHKAAEKSGSLIVGACAYESIPFEIATNWLREKFDGTLLSVEGFTRIIASADGMTINHGTWDSLIHAFGRLREMYRVHKQVMQAYPNPLPNYKYGIPVSTRLPGHHDIISGVCLWTPDVDTMVAERTNLYNFNKRKERPIAVARYISFPGWIHWFVVGFLAIAFGWLSFFKRGRKLLIDNPELFSLGFATKKGPTQAQVDGTSFEIVLRARGWREKYKGPLSGEPDSEPDKTLYARITGPEPTYPATSMCLIQAAITLVKERDSIAMKGGVFTPAVAFRDTSIVERLCRNSFTYEIIGNLV